MKYVFNIDEERHFYFGDIFFKQFVGIFDMANGLLGMAKSNKASSNSVTFECIGEWCIESDEETQATDTVPTPTPDPEPTPEPTPEPVDPTDPTDPTDPENGRDDMFWIWIIIGMGVVLLLAIFCAIYYCMQSRKKDKWAAIQYANGRDGDLIEKDVEKYAGKGDRRVNQFDDHQELMQSSHQIVEDEPIPSPYGVQ